MSATEKVKALLALSGKKQVELAKEFDMSPQTMSNKMARGSWSAADLAKVAAFCELAFVFPNGEKIIIE